MSRNELTNNKVILVDEQDCLIGTMGKLEAHLGAGQLHRAFSVFVQRSDGRILLQQRAAGKLLWPGFWSNSCCSHPMPGEAIEDAGARRLEEELGLTAPCQRLYSFEYREEFGDTGVEHELCHVLFARCDDHPVPHPEEIANIAWLTMEEITARITSAPQDLTPWFRKEWVHLTAHHASLLTTRTKKDYTAC